jgi:hypothetical protein
MHRAKAPCDPSCAISSSDQGRRRMRGRFDRDDGTAVAARHGRLYLSGQPSRDIIRVRVGSDDPHQRIDAADLAATHDRDSILGADVHAGRLHDPKAVAEARCLERATKVVPERRTIALALALSAHQHQFPPVRSLPWNVGFAETAGHACSRPDGSNEGNGIALDGRCESDGVNVDVDPGRRRHVVQRCQVVATRSSISGVAAASFRPPAMLHPHFERYL